MYLDQGCPNFFHCGPHIEVHTPWMATNGGQCSQTFYWEHLAEVLTVTPHLYLSLEPQCSSDSH